MMIALTTMIPLVGLLQAQQPPSNECVYDRAAMLALDQKSFDQDMTGGWRQLSNDGCDVEAADLIRLWREAHASQDSLLFWHEGQLRANAGQTEAAILLFERSRKTPAEDAGYGWNLYVDGTLAFLRSDRAGLESVREELAKLPRPDGFSSLTAPDGKPVTLDWPMNLNVLDGFLRCWCQPYKKAYSCAKPMFTYSKPQAG